MRLPCVLLVGLVMAACTSGESADAADPEVTRAQRDSAIAESDLPGAAAVGRAIDASEAARERAARMDSLTR